jgi:hypothetical protein
MAANHRREGMPSAADIREVAQHALMASHGVRPSAMHPGAERLTDLGRAYTWIDAAQAALQIRDGVPTQTRPGGNPVREVYAALSTSDYPSIVEQTLCAALPARTSRPRWPMWPP